MDLPLPLDQFRFNIILRILITAYGASGIGNFMAFVPGCSKEDAEILWYNNKSNYSFWLISSLLFFILWISQFQFISFIYLTMGEIYLTIIIYLRLMIKNERYSKQNREKIKQMKKSRMDEIKGK